MISLKRYLNSNTDSSAGDLLSSMLDAYRSALTAMGICAVQACPPVGQDLQRSLTTFGQQLSATADADLVASTHAGVESELQQWGDRAEGYLQQKTNEVKELLVVVARTAATIGASDERYAKQFDAFTARLQSIANLEDLTEVRKSLVQSAAELKSCVERMSQDTRKSVTDLQAEVVTYQTKLEEAEQAASRDALTGLFNRSKILSQIDQRVMAGQTFSVAMIDLNGFKQVNDRFGHAAGDDLLTQFSAELRSNARSGDLVGRWGGDEFIVVLSGGRSEAQSHIERIEKWVAGDYTIESSTGPQKVRLDASIGLAEWSPGKTVSEIIDQADSAMYTHKGTRRTSTPAHT